MTIKIHEAAILLVLIFATAFCTAGLLSLMGFNTSSQRPWIILLSLGMVLCPFLLGVLCGTHEPN